MKLPGFLQEIIHSKATLKIITKTKNEKFFIEKWIKHHLKIIGEGKLIIFDNMSDDQHVLQVYEKYKDSILLVKFDFHHNSVHDYMIMKEMYDAIGKSSSFFTVLDTDEFLYLYDDNTAIQDNSIIDYLKKNTECDFFAPCWLENIEGEERILNLNSAINGQRKKAELIELFDWGKAIINSKIFNNPKLHKFNEVPFRHTAELPLLSYKKAKTKFFIAHLKNLSAQQRLLANIAKLVSSGLLKSFSDLKYLLSLNDTSTENQALRSYIKETKELAKRVQSGSSLLPCKVEKKKLVEIGLDNKLYFSNTFTKQAFLSLANANYLDLINYNYSKSNEKEYKLLVHWMNKYNYIEWY